MNYNLLISDLLILIKFYFIFRSETTLNCLRNYDSNKFADVSKQTNKYLICLAASNQLNLYAEHCFQQEKNMKFICEKGFINFNCLKYYIFSNQSYHISQF